MLLAAARELAQAGELPVNVRFCCDGEEETGRPLDRRVPRGRRARRRRGDHLRQRHDPPRRAGVQPRDARAWRTSTSTLRTGERDLHSGIYGGAALNAAHALITTLDALIAHDGALAEPLRKGIAPPTEEELARLARAAGRAPTSSPSRARAPKDARAADEFYLRTFAEPALDVNGIATGSPHLQKTVLPVEAVANVSIRLAPGQKVEEIAPEVERLLREAAPAGRRARDRAAGRPSPPGLVPPDAKAIQLGLDAFERALGRRPALIRSGGTLPIVPALADKGIPTIITGFGLPDSQIHSPNERLVAEYVPLGIAAARELFSRSRALSADAASRRRPAAAGGARSASSGSPGCPARGRRRARPASPRPGRASSRAARGSRTVIRSPAFSCDGVDHGRDLALPEQEDRAVVVGERLVERLAEHRAQRGQLPLVTCSAMWPPDCGPATVPT